MPTRPTSNFLLEVGKFNDAPKTADWSYYRKFIDVKPKELNLRLRNGLKMIEFDKNDLSKWF